MEQGSTSTSFAGVTSSSVVSSTGGKATTRPQSSTTSWLVVTSTMPPAPVTSAVATLPPAVTQPVSSMAAVVASNIVAYSTSTFTSASFGPPVTLSIRTLVTIPGYEPVADAGGPYFAASGSAVFFDGSRSRSAGKLVDFVWDFGDNSSGRGQTVSHIYKDVGLYRLTLVVVDDAGRKAVDSKVVYVSTPSIYVYVDVLPSKEAYYYGDVITGVDAVLSYSDGSPVAGASVMGSFSGVTSLPLSLRDSGGGHYHADLNYQIMPGEDDYIDVYLNASDSLGRRGSGLKKLIVAPSDARMVLSVEKPFSGKCAYGQEIEFQVRMKSMEGVSFDKGDVLLYETWSPEKYRFRKEGDAYVFAYTVPSSVGDRVILLLYGTAISGGKKYKALKEVSLQLSHDLTVKPVGLSDSSELLLNVSYPDGSAVPFSLLRAEVGNVSFFLQNRQGLFSGLYPAPENSKSYVWVTDVYGNAGGSEVLLMTGSPGGLDATVKTLLSGLAILVLLMLPLYALYNRRKSRRQRLREEYEDAKERMHSLEALQKKVMHDYYTRKITDVEARKSIFECNKDLVVERGKLKDAMKKLGMSNAAPPKEGAVEWVADRLRLGEDPNSVKESLEKIGMDPGLVEKAKKSLAEEAGEKTE